jgi:predicted esterase
MKFRLINILLFLFFCLNFKYTKAQSKETLAVSEVIDSITCRNNPKYSYALYLPKNYSDSIKWPIIFIFDPGARGMVPVKKYSYIAELYNFILAGSNNSKNGPWEDNFTAANLMIKDVKQRFSLNPNQIYTCGFSGGSRVALAIASTKDSITGVIGCGAGLPNEIEFQPTTDSQFEYYGIYGLYDINYREIERIKPVLEKFHIHYKINLFEGKHEWPPDIIIADAIEFFTIQAMKKGQTPLDSMFIVSAYEKNLLAIEKLTEKNQLLLKRDLCIYTINCFKGLINTNNLEELENQINLSKEYKRECLKNDKALKKELVKAKIYMQDLNQIYSDSQHADSILNYWKNEIRNLKRQTYSKNYYNSVTAKRILVLLSETAAERGFENNHSGDFEHALIFFELWSLIESENMYAQYYFSKVLFDLNRPKESLNAFKNAEYLGIDISWVLKHDKTYGDFLLPILKQEFNNLIKRKTLL